MRLWPTPEVLQAEVKVTGARISPKKLWRGSRGLRRTFPDVESALSRLMSGVAIDMWRDIRLDESRLGMYDSMLVNLRGGLVGLSLA